MGSWDEAARSTQIAYYRLLASSPFAETRAAGDGLAVATGIRSNTENGVASSTAPQVEIESTIAWFQERDAPAMWLGAGSELRGALVAAGCRPDVGGIDMGCDLRRLELPPAAPPPGVDVRRVRSVTELEHALALLDDGDDLERTVSVFSSLGFDDAAPLRHYVASDDRGVVGMAAAFSTEDVVLLQHVVVVERCRRRGLGRALALTRLRDARDRGCTAAVLGPTPESRRLYEPLGFTVTPSARAGVLYLPLVPRGG